MASFEDRPAIVRMLRDAHAAAGDTFPFAFSMRHAVSVANEHLTRPDRLALVVDGGVLLAAAQQHPFADVKYAMETVWWVDPDVRGGRTAVHMLRDYEEWARDQGCAFIQMAALATFPRAGKIYERCGYRPTETHYLKELA